jgi:hypothetical protein
MKTKKLKLLSILLLLLPLCLFLGTGCRDYEDIPLKYTKCPCDSEMSLIEKITMYEILLFDASKTPLSEMKKLSTRGERSLFISYSPETDSTFFYSFTKISNFLYTNTGHICNFPGEAKQWEIPSTGISVSFSADVFEACNGLPSSGSVQTYTDDVLTSLKKHKK